MNITRICAHVSFLLVIVLKLRVFLQHIIYIPAGNYMFKVNSRNTRTRCEICSKLLIKIPERRQWCRSGAFIVNFKHVSHLVLVFLLLTLSKCMLAGIVTRGV